MSPEELVSELSIAIYEPPLNELRRNGAIADLSDPLHVVILILDFDTEVSMNGINDFLANSTGRYALQTVSALRQIGCGIQASQLQRIIDIATDAGMTHHAIQQDRASLEPYAVTTFSELHGNKWDTASAEIRKIDAEIDYSGVISLTEDFVGSHSTRFHRALGQ